MAGVGGYYWYKQQGKAGNGGAPPPKDEAQNVPAQAEPMMVFKGGDQGFISLLLDKVEVINHNVKRFRFKLPEEESVSGLQVACIPIPRASTRDRG